MADENNPVVEANVYDKLVNVNQAKILKESCIDEQQKTYTVIYRGGGDQDPRWKMFFEATFSAENNQTRQINIPIRITPNVLSILSDNVFGVMHIILERSSGGKAELSVCALMWEYVNILVDTSKYKIAYYLDDTNTYHVAGFVNCSKSYEGMIFTPIWNPKIVPIDVVFYDRNDKEFLTEIPAEYTTVIDSTVMPLLNVSQNVSNPNLLINPDFRINQRGKTSYGTFQYSVDRWKTSYHGALSVNADGTVTLSNDGEGSWLHQYFEYDVTKFLTGKTVTISICVDGQIFSASGKVPEGVFPEAKCVAAVDVNNDTGFALYRFGDGTSMVAQLHCAPGTSITPEWVKLELGSIATPFVPPDPATELIKCQRYYQIRSTGDIAEVDLRPSMAAIPEIKQREDGNYEYIAEL